MNNYIINQMNNCYMSSDEGKASQIKHWVGDGVLIGSLKFNRILVDIRENIHLIPIYSLGQVEHNRISTWGLQQRRVSGLRIIQTVAQNGQRLHFGIRHSWNHISVSFVGMKV